MQHPMPSGTRLNAQFNESISPAGLRVMGGDR